MRERTAIANSQQPTADARMDAMGARGALWFIASIPAAVLAMGALIAVWPAAVGGLVALFGVMAGVRVRRHR